MSKSDAKPDFRRSKSYRQLKNFMLADLESRGFTGKVFTDKVDEYLTFWGRLQELQADIDARGVSVLDGRGNTVENRSMSLAIQVSRQMLAICSLLGFKADSLKEALTNPSDEDL